MIVYDKLALWVARHPLMARVYTVVFGTVTVAAATWLADAGLLDGAVVTGLRSVFGL